MRMRNTLLLVGLLGGLPLAAGSLPAAAEPGESIAPDVQADKLLDLREKYPFKTLDNPKRVPAAEASFLRDDDLVLALTVDGESCAYPTRFLGWHHGVNDRVRETPFAVTFCSVCNTGIAYDLRLDGKPVFLDFYGLYNGVVLLCDRQTGSVFLQAEGRFVKGPLTGKSLNHLPVLDITWGEWRKLHPQTTVMSPDTRFSDRYRPVGSPQVRGNSRLSPFFISTLTRGDLRLSPFESVLGIALAASGDAGKKAYRAYPVQVVLDAGGVVNDDSPGQAVAVFVDPGTRSASAVSRVLEGRTLTFEARKEGDGGFAIYDRETGSRWNLEGKAESGPLAGKTLTSMAGNRSQWYGWAAYFPETSIYGRNDPPKPGNPFEEKP